MTARLAQLAIAIGALTVLAPVVAAGERSQLSVLRGVVRDLEQQVERMELSAWRQERWRSCLRPVPVSEYGHPDRQSGYRYDEGDGSGLSFMPALAIDRRDGGRRADYTFLHLPQGRGCGSAPPTPGGTADTSMRRRTPATGLRGLERRARRLRRAAARLAATAEDFDAWESCVSWIPVTEYGDPGGRFGYLFGHSDLPGFSYRSALAVDRSDWDDPDYMLLAFVGRDRPGWECRDEPGEADD